MTAEALAERIADARRTGARLSIRGGGTKSVPRDDTLDMTVFAGIVAHEPAELTLTIGAGTRLDEVEVLLAAHGQRLAFDPPSPPPFGRPGRQTIGGVIAGNAAGPRRLKGGAPRDHLLGFTAVSGHGEVFRAGGRVVKNVTGFDLCKLMAGSRGTLAALTEVTVRVMPASPVSLTLALSGLDDAAAVAVLNAAVGSAADVSAAAHVAGGQTAVRLEGFAGSVAARAATVRASWSATGSIVAMTGEDEARFWTAIATVSPIADARHPVWRIVVPPAASPGVVAALGGDAVYDWGGGLVWLATASGPARVHAIAGGAGGHARCVRGDGGGLSRDVGGLALAERVRAAFDPDGVFGDA